MKTEYAVGDAGCLGVEGRPAVVLLGPSRHAVSGVSTHLNQMLGSKLASEFGLAQFQVGSEGHSESSVQKLLRLLVSPAGLALCIARRKPKIVHLNTSIEPRSFWRDAVYLMISKAMGRKIVYQVHGGELPNVFFRGHPLLTEFLRWVLTLPDAVVVLAQCEAAVYREFAAIQRLRMIPNAIDVNEFGVANGKLFCAKSRTFGYIGRLAKDKGIFDIVEALRLVRERGSVPFTLQIAGSGPEEAALKTAVCAAGLQDQTRFLGAVFGQDKLDFWRSTDLFLFPTYHREGLPYAVLESLASGTPIVSTRIGGIPDALVDGVHGCFVTPQAPAELADVIERLAPDAEWLRMASVHCAKQAWEHYSVDRLAEQFSEVYRAVLA